MLQVWLKNSLKALSLELEKIGHVKAFLNEPYVDSIVPVACIHITISYTISFSFQHDRLTKMWHLLPVPDECLATHNISKFVTYTKNIDSSMCCSEKSGNEKITGYKYSNGIQVMSNERRDWK
ncbi:hypothetical protein F5141DRAFT_1063537 [Pisolithus sp. B1]|nr:hypothetical protein F5141DRAFT_1063537 [Pisolithus sp. B1]